MFPDSICIGEITDQRRIQNPVKLVRWILRPEACNFVKKETLTRVFSCEFCEISKNTFFTEHLWTTASGI